MEGNTAAVWVSLPPEPVAALAALEKAGKEAYLVGGCVRDLIIGRNPKDWDVTTNATPEEIIAAFPHTHYENDFGTVGVVFDDAKRDTEKVIEVTPYRMEAGYSDSRHPDTIRFSQNIGDDLKRRDFTVNAIALKIVENKGDSYKGHIVDLYGGVRDLHAKVIQTVGIPDDRFNEDGLRILRAIRFATELGFTINTDTERSIIENRDILSRISKERLRDEFEKIIRSDDPMTGMLLLKKLNVMPFVIPELEHSYGIEQNQAHSFDVWEHLIRSLAHAAKKGMDFDVRLAALLHDIGKPATRRKGEGGDWTFYGHEVVSAKMARNILNRLKFPMKLVESVCKLVRWHMFFSDTEVITLSAVRRIVAKVGRENIWKLMELRTCDRIGTGRPKEDPYRLRKYKAMVEEALRDPISVNMLAVDGKMIMETLGIAPGPIIGDILHALLEEVLEDPKKNTLEYQKSRSVELSKLPSEELRRLGEQGREKKGEEEDAAVGEIRSRYHVK